MGNRPIGIPLTNTIIIKRARNVAMHLRPRHRRWIEELITAHERSQERLLFAIGEATHHIDENKFLKDELERLQWTSDS